MRRKASNKASSPKNSQQGEDHTAQNKKEAKTEVGSKTSSGGSILLEKVNENLESLLRALKGRVTLKTTLPTNLQDYPNPI